LRFALVRRIWKDCGETVLSVIERERQVGLSG